MCVCCLAIDRGFVNFIRRKKHAQNAKCESWKNAVHRPLVRESESALQM